jgi:hypothetical protein
VPIGIPPLTFEASVLVLENVSNLLTMGGHRLNEVEEEIAGPTEVASRISTCEKSKKGVPAVAIFVILTV